MRLDILFFPSLFFSRYSNIHTKDNYIYTYPHPTRVTFRCSLVRAGGSRNRNSNILWAVMRTCSPNGTPPAPRIQERRTVPDRAAHPPGKASSRSAAIHCQEVRECNHDYSAIYRSTLCDDLELNVRDKNYVYWKFNEKHFTLNDFLRMICKSSSIKVHCKLYIQIFHVVECWHASLQKLNFFSNTFFLFNLHFTSTY